MLIFITDDGFPEDFTLKLIITSTAFKIEEEILSIVFGKESPLIFAELEIKGELIDLIIFFNSGTGVTLNDISFKSLDKKEYFFCNLDIL